jgi:CubicO group peptidase (beta-lactamase class C family)
MSRFSWHRVIWPALLIIGAAALCPAQAPRDFGELEKVALEELRALNVPGAAIGIVSGERLVFAKGFGTANIETGAPVTPEMLFRLGSTTKMFTAAALVMLAEEGRIRLDEPIGTAVRGLDPGLASLTAHQLLSHTSGMLDEAPMYGSQDESALAREVRSWKEDRLFTRPGEIYSYSNPAYWLAGYVIEELSGKPYADAMNDRLFAPLGMARTTFRPTMAMTYPLAQGHDVRAGQPPFIVRPHANNAASWPAGSIFSSVQDLSRFVIAFMNGGRIDGKQVLPPAVITRLSTPYVAIPGEADSRYGYGLIVRNYRGVRMLQHGGSRTGYGSLIWMAPDERCAVIVLANRSGAGMSRTADKAMETMIALAPRPAEEKPPEMPLTDADRTSWTGTYFHPPSQKVEIVLKEGKLFLRRGTSELEIRKTGENSFMALAPGSSQGQRYVLVPGKDGAIAYLFSGGRALIKHNAP